MFGYDDLCDAFQRGAVVVFEHLVVFGAVDEGYDIGILLDTTGFAEVRQLWAFAAPPHFYGPAELGECDDRHLQFFCQAFQGPGDRADLLFAVAALVFAPTAHELQVVNDDELDIVLQLHAPTLGSEFKDIDAGGIVYIDRCVANALYGAAQLLALVFLELTRAQVGEGDFRLHGDEALGELQGRHFQGEQGNALAVVHGGIFGQGEHERSLTHARSGGDDDEVGGLPPGSEAVEHGEARRYTGQPFFLIFEFFDLF